MKKLLLNILLVTAVSTAGFAQQGYDKAKKQLSTNLGNIAELDKMIAENYNMMKTGVDAVKNTTFTFNECMVLGSFGDEAFQKQMKEYEKGLGDIFNGSTWKFGPYDKNGQSTYTVSAKNGQSETSVYNGFEGRATVNMGSTIITGITLEPYFYQKKDDAKSYLMMFAITNGMICVVDLTKK